MKRIQILFTSVFALILFALGNLFFANSALAVDTYVNCSGTSASPTAVDEATLNGTPGNNVIFTDAGGDGYCILDATLNPDSVVIETGVVLTHGAADTNGLTITTGSLDLQSGGSINVNAKGYPAQVGTGAGTTGGATYGGSGAGYGGGGGTDAYGRMPLGITYGSATQPAALGSGGGSGWGGSGTSGGGAVKLTVSGTLTINGTISANGGVSGAEVGGGSGGSVWVDSSTLSGSGSISADGGYGANRGSSGGGGRIAIYYNTDSSTITSHAYGGTINSGLYGGAGTIYIDDKDDSLSNNTLIVDNNDKTGEVTTQATTASQTYDAVIIKNGARYVIPNTFTLTISSTGSLTGSGSTQPKITVESGAVFSPPTTGAFTLNGIDVDNSGTVNTITNLTLTDSTYIHNGTFGATLTALTLGTGGTFVAQSATFSPTTLTVQSGGTFEQRKLGALSIPNITVQSGGTLTHTANSTTKAYELNLSSTTIDIQSGGFINISAKGFSPGYGTGKGTYHVAGTGSGGGYGGAGGLDLYGSAGGITYGSATEPTDLGSGSGMGQRGGGAMKLVVSGTLTINGTVSSNGGNGGGWEGGGSGGSVWLDAGTFSGNGTISADGGSGSGRGGSGGGGRIAITYVTNSSSTTRTVNGGTGGASAGSDGTISFLQKSPLTTNFPTANGTTDFSAISDFTALSNMKLATSQGSILWNGATVNAETEDYDSYVNIGDGFVSINPANVRDSLSNDSGTVSGFNARVSIAVNGCDTYSIYYYNAFSSSLNDIITNGQTCNEGTSPACTNITCTNNLLSFDVPHFDSYGGEGDGPTLTTTVSVGNLSPVFTATPGDGGSDSTSPTVVGSDVTFTATAMDVNTDQYYLAVCKTDAITAGNNSAPSCDGGAWAISTVTNSSAQASVPYTTLVGDAESNAWYAFVCDKFAGGGSCYPANGAGDQGLALGTISFSDVPTSQLAFTVDNVSYGFDPLGICPDANPDVCIDSSALEDGFDAASAFASAEAGTTTHVVNRGTIAYVYADSKGADSNSTAMSINTCVQCTLSGATLAGGSNSNMSPFNVNHAGTFGTVTVTDDGVTEYGTADTDIEPGETLLFTLPSSELADADTVSSQDLMTMYICTEATTAFDYSTNSCTGGSLVCSSSAVNPTTTDATCTGGASLISVPTAHGSYDFKVYVEDTHSTPATGTETQSYTVIDVAPTLITYTATDEPAPSAGGSDTVDFSLSLTDINGDNDVSNVKGVFFDPAAVTHDCTANENNCYIQSSCTLSEVSTPGTGKTSLGPDAELVASCSVTVWFNANANNWDVQAEVTDDAVNTEFADSGTQLTNPALHGIDVVEGSIAYGSVAIGGSSIGQETSMGNVGNQVLDVYIDGDDMCTDYPTCAGGSTTKIPVAQQKWHHNSQTFDWDTNASGPGPYSMVNTATGDADAGGCLNRDIAVRSDHTATTTNESIFWKLRIPASQSVGSYTGQTTFSTTASSTCTSGVSY